MAVPVVETSWASTYVSYDRPNFRENFTFQKEKDDKFIYDILNNCVLYGALIFLTTRPKWLCGSSKLEILKLDNKLEFFCNFY